MWMVPRPQIFFTETAITDGIFSVWMLATRLNVMLNYYCFVEGWVLGG
jgi:hypothetical protein